MKHLFFTLSIAAVWTAGALNGMNYQTWKTCLGQVGRQDCVLDAGYYVMNETITVAHGVKLSGGGVLPDSTVLVRGSFFQDTLLHVNNGSSVTIENIAFDGNRDIYNSCPSTNANIYEVNNQGYAHIERVAFRNSRGASLVMVYGALVNSTIEGSRSTGMFLGRGAVLTSEFTNNGTAAINMYGSEAKGVYSNYFYRNRWEMSDNSGGGQIYIAPGSTSSTVYNNTIDGADWITTGGTVNGCPTVYGERVFGIEVEPDSGSNYLYGNEIIAHTGAGIIANAVSSLTISGYNLVDCPYYTCGARYIHDNYGTPWSSGGIEIINNNGTSELIELDTVLSRSNTGVAVHVDNGATGPGWRGNHCLAWGYDTSSAFDAGGQTPASTTTCP